LRRLFSLFFFFFFFFFFEKLFQKKGSFDFANSSLYATSDIDMFLFGFSEHLDYVKKAEEIQTYFEKHFGPILTLRNSNNFVFVLPFPYRRVSVALGQWASAADIL
jgi:hypothetical protein